MIALENGLERKRIIYISYKGLERYISAYNWNMYFSIDGDTQVLTII